jgi:hypothetical protein
MQGFAALVTAGIVASDQIESLVADAIGRFLHGPVGYGHVSTS